MVIGCADSETFVERKVITVLDIFSVAGGFANILMFITEIISKTYSKPLLYHNLARKLFK